MMGRDKYCTASDSVTNKWGEIFKQERLKKDYTREQLSERAGISVRYIIAIENEKQLPKAKVLTKLIRGLGISADTIFYPETKKQDTDIDELVRLLYSCDKRDRKIIRALVDSMLDST